MARWLLKVNFMEWIKLQLHVIRSEQYIGCEPVQRATYINLLAYCVDQENGGSIINSLDWNDRKWMQLCGVMKSEVEDCELFWFQDGDLFIYAYPIDEQKSCESKRKKCRLAQLSRWERQRSRSPTPESTSPTNNGRSPTTDEISPSTEERREEETIPEETREDLFAPSTEPVVIDPANEWHSIKMNPWIQMLKVNHCKIGPNNWQEWESINVKHSTEKILQAAEGIKPDERWPDKVLMALGPQLGSTDGMQRNSKGKIVL